MKRLTSSAIAVVVVALCVAPETSHASCVVPANAIEAENCLPGSPPSQWQISGTGDFSIQGFSTDISVDQGQTVDFKVKTDATDYRLDIYRMGYYGGDGARLVATVQPSVALPQVQPACLFDAVTKLLDCGNWGVSASWAVPAGATSGIYFAKLVREDPADGRASHVVFIVRDDDGGSEIIFQTQDSTWQAYNRWNETGSASGNSTYGGPGGKADKVSYNRPFGTRSGTPEDWVFNAEYPMVRWLERNGYEVSYFTDVDSDRIGAELLEHSAYLSIGHDEYWSRAQRDNVTAARDAGVHLAFLSGNEIYWKIRWEDSVDGASTPYRTMVTYKEGTLGENNCGGKCDPLPNVWTGLWRDGCAFTPPADGCEPENSLSGQISWVGSTSSIQVPAEFAPLRFWRNSPVAALTTGQTATLGGGTLGYEWDFEQFEEFYPAGRVAMSRTTLGGRTHKLSLYRHASGALVFGAGTVQWSWGLDGNHDRGSAAPDTSMQQATVNFLADMGVLPTTLQAGLVPAVPSNDTTGPVSTITFPTPSSPVEVGEALVIVGTASDAAGVVGGVEVSVDGGLSWDAADGLESWSYIWFPSAVGPTTLMARAVDDLGNIESTPASVTVDVDPQTCPCSIWNDLVVPGEESSTDTQAIEVGVKFRADSDGFVTALRFYKGALNVGTHIGNLWTTGGALLATVTFTGETASGWQEQALAVAVPISAGTTYVASYYTAVGRYAFDSGFLLTQGVDAPPLHVLQNGVDGPNGVYAYSAVSTFPTSTFNGSNYWVDVVVAIDDVDGDGFPIPADCDDTDDTVFPGAPELCDGKDNDCDTVVDDGNPESGGGCATGLLGECAAGTEQCIGGSLQCVANNSPVSELCDALDNDCDGTTDEGDPGGGGSCGVSSVGLCQLGVEQCLVGSLACVGNVDPAPELCDGLDNDCDGTADNGNPGSGGSCATGQPGICAAGTEQCLGGSVQCVADQSPGAEVCNGLDDDCDGTVDEGTSSGSCSTGQLGSCASGTEQCVSGSLLCVRNTPPTTETCNGIDDDCDGSTDEGNPGGGGSCSTGLPGPCAAGIFQCQGGALQCVGTAAEPEVCDGLDNDCDGSTDEGTGGGACSTGQPACSIGVAVCESGSLVCDADGQPCDDGDACTQTDTCDGAAQCLGGDPVTCAGPTDCASAEMCNTTTGVCDAGTPLAAGTPCTADADICTDDECEGTGACDHVFDPGNDPSCVVPTTVTTSTTGTTGPSLTTTTTLPAAPCGPQPRVSGCFAGGRATLQLKDSSDDGRDQLKWKWTRGDATAQSDMGNPLTTTTYALCIYDNTAATPALVASVEIGPNAAWDDKDPKGWNYKDKLGAFDGVQKLQLKTGAAGKSKAQIKARGLNIPMPAPFGAEYFDADPGVIAQLVNDEDQCWTSEFTSATRNELDQYKAKAP